MYDLDRRREYPATFVGDQKVEAAQESAKTSGEFGAEIRQRCRCHFVRKPAEPSSTRRGKDSHAEVRLSAFNCVASKGQKKFIFLDILL